MERRARDASTRVDTAPTFNSTDDAVLLPFVWSYGMGAESTVAAIHRMLTDPDARPDTIAPDFANLVIVIAQTGDEWSTTGELVEKSVNCARILATTSGSAARRSAYMSLRTPAPVIATITDRGIGTRPTARSSLVRAITTSTDRAKPMPAVPIGMTPHNPSSGRCAARTATAPPREFRATTVGPWAAMTSAKKSSSCSSAGPGRSGGRRRRSRAGRRRPPPPAFASSVSTPRQVSALSPNPCARTTHGPLPSTLSSRVA